MWKSQSMALPSPAKQKIQDPIYINWVPFPGNMNFQQSDKKRKKISWITFISGFPSGSVIRNSPANAGDMDLIPGWKDPLEEEMATHSSILAWKILWTEEPGGLRFIELQRVGHHWVTEHARTHVHSFQHDDWDRNWIVSEIWIPKVSLISTLLS